MSNIGRTQLLEDILFWLPSNNTLSDFEIAKLYEIVISDVGDDDVNYKEVLCKSLKSCAKKNRLDAIINQGNLKSQSIGKFSESYYQDGVREIWDLYLRELSELCTTEIGYTFSNEGIGHIYMNPGDTITVNDVDDTSEATIL